MRAPKNAIEEIEWARRRLERAKRLIEDGLIQKVKTPDGESYICRSQSQPEDRYLVERASCPCQDEFHLSGQKLCKHILARLILEEGFDLKEIGKDPLYWQRKKREAEGLHSPKTLRPLPPQRILPKASRRSQR